MPSRRESTLDGEDTGKLIFSTNGVISVEGIRQNDGTSTKASSVYAVVPKALRAFLFVMASPRRPELARHWQINVEEQHSERTFRGPACAGGDPRGFVRRHGVLRSPSSKRHPQTRN
ncbi:hypothetical protein CIHG_01321 [Coccidioides immitis H538.4]|uniref:Uncharacterized protein n=1 Tax=Coccidioides immitis H538.4 TaxID=396776 RepID=A0A0J8U8X9_COCIT|nr:hypothetical protein CIHG_01321 [Coccidioides immitis H538.4]